MWQPTCGCGHTTTIPVKRSTAFVKANFYNFMSNKTRLHLALKYADVEIPQKGDLISANYAGLMGGYHCFSINGLKDLIRVDSRLSETKYLKNTQIGDSVEVLIDSVDDVDFTIHGTLVGLYENKAHESISLDENLVLKCYIKEMNAAGYDVDVFYEGVTLAGFMPNTLAGINKLHDPSAIVGKHLELMIESFSKDEGTYIVSRRKYLKTLISDSIKKLDFNQVYTGHVTGTTPFGVFVEFNECLTGMVHKANISDEWRERISEIRPGMEIDFYVKEIVTGDKIILTQIIRETLWDTIKNGQILTGKVRDIKRFGVLVTLDEETLGLIHTSEVEKSKREFNQDEEVKVKVLSVDRKNRKIFLSCVK